MRSIPKRLAGVAVAAALVLSAAACYTRAPSDQIILYYKAGTGDNKKFQECIQPGGDGTYPIDDEIFALPVSLRTWNISPQDGGDTKEPIKSGSRPVLNTDGKTTQPGPEVVVFATADFYLNTDCGKNGKDANSPIVQFWQQTGRRPWVDGHGVSVDDEDGFQLDAWKVMLQNTLVPAEQAAIREQTRNYTADELDANLNGVWRDMEKRLGPLFNDLLRQKVGGDYFCGTGYQRGKTVSWTEPVVGDDGKVSQSKKDGTCPPVRITITDINFADAGIAASRANVFKAQQDAQTALIEAQKQVDVAAKLSQVGKDPTYLRLKELEVQAKLADACAKNPNCTVISGAGVGVNVTTK